MGKVLEGPTEYKTVPYIQLKVEQDKGIVEHLITVYGVEDLGGDISHPGSFAKTISERADQIRVLDSHNRQSVLGVVGVPLELKEIGRDELPKKVLERYPEATGGLWARTRFLLDTPEGRGVFTRIKEGAVSEFSYAYDALDEDYTKGKDGHEIRNLRTIRLWEYSPVVFGMNPATAVLGTKGVCGSTRLPIADRNRTWDASAAVMRVRSWADAKEKPNAKYRGAFFWYDAKNADNFGAYKLPFADVINGTLTAIPRGIFAVAGVLSGAHGGAEITDVEAVKSRVAGYYARMRKKFNDESIVVPWKKKSEYLEYKPAPDVTENTIRIRVRDPDDFQEGSFRTIRIGSEDEGIQATIGRLKGETSTTVQSYIFDKDKWTVARAQAWVDEHKKALIILVPEDKDEDEDEEPGGPEFCVCPKCGYEEEKKRGVPCRSVTCPKCGTKLVAKEPAPPEQGEEARGQKLLEVELELEQIDVVLLSEDEAGPAE